jgi:excisionase family DNA binding protein
MHSPTKFPDPQTTPTLTVEEAGQIMGVGRSLAYAAARDGSLPTIRLGKRILVPTASLLRMLEEA